MEEKPAEEASAKTDWYDPQWKEMYQAGAIASWCMAAIIPIQLVVFAVWPPPESAVMFYEQTARNELLGLLSLDILYLVDNSLLIFLYLAMYFALKKAAPSLVLISVVFGLLGTATYLASAVPFEMVSLSRDYAEATTEIERAQLVAAGEALLKRFKGTPFSLYYVFNALALLGLAHVMWWRATVFTKATAFWGLLAGLLMLVPSSTGSVGSALAIASLSPWIFFCLLTARQLWRFTRPEKTKYL